jgi:sugar fermentation stimulation protein A
MLGLLRPGVEVVLSPAPGAERKLPWTLEMVKHQGFWVGVNTLVPNRMLKAAWKAGSIPELKGWDRFRPEVRVMGSRLDACLERDGQRLWVEAKNVTLVEDEVACFPDAVSIRARRHLTELMALAAQGDLAACFYLVQRPDGRCFGPADFIDPDFADVFRQARRAGVRMWAHAATVDARGIGLGIRLPLAPGPL